MSIPPANDDGLDPQAETLAWLARPETYGGDVATVERIDTHISSVFLAGSFAYKLKRAVQLPFLDFRSLGQREAICRRELAINRRTAPGIYVDVIAIRRDAAGGLRFGGEGEAVDWLVVMKRFSQDDLFDRLAGEGRLTRDDIRQMADAVADLHQTAAVQPEWGGAKGIASTIETNAQTFAQLVPGLFDAGEVEVVTGRSVVWLRLLADLLDRRRQGGFVRHCHGDLHLGNICRFEGRPTLFDAIEFNDGFAFIDVFYDIAFLIMDLRAQGLADMASRLFNRYLERTGDIDALAALPLFLSLRAAIRAHVSAVMAVNSGDDRRRRDAHAYLAAAGAYLSPASPRLVAVGGFSGSGKSSLARNLASWLTPAPGAVVLRSDVLRKRLMGVAPEVRLSEDAYKAEVTEQTYRVLFDLARRALNAGQSVIADAVFAAPEQRVAIEALADSVHRPFSGLWLEAGADAMRQRVRDRRGDASDATVQVLDKQLASSVGPLAWAKLDTSGSPDQSLATARQMLGL